MLRRQIDRLSIRQLLILLFVLIALPCAATVAWLLASDLRRALHQAESQVALLARTTAQSVEQLLRDHESVLMRLASRPLVKALDPSQCDPLIQEYVHLRPELTTVTVRDARGTAVCSSLAKPPAHEQVRPWLDPMKSSEGFRVGDPILGPLSGRWVTVFTHPIVNESWQTTGMVVAPFQLEELRRRILRPLEPGALVMLASTSGMILVHSEAHEEHVGKPLPPGLMRRIAAPEVGVLHETGSDDVPRLYAHVPLTDGWHVFAALTERSAYAAYREQLWSSIAIGAVLAVVLLLITRSFARAIVQPIGRLADTAAAVATGQAGVRAPVGGPAEVADVGAQLNRMLELRDRQRDEAERKQAQMLALQEVFASPALETGDVAALAPRVTEAAARVTGAARANLWLFNDDETELRCIDLYEAPLDRHTSGMCLSEAQFRNEFAALKRAHYVDAEDALSDPRTVGYAEGYLIPHDIRSMLDAVIVVSGKHLGLLCIEHVGRRHVWSQDEIAFACQMADKVAATLANRARQEAQESLLLSNRLLRETERIAEIGGWQWDVGRDSLVCSEQVYRILQRPAGSASTLADYLSFVHPADRARIRHALDACFAEQMVFDLHYRIVRPDGSLRTVHAQAEILRDERRSPVSMMGTLHDVTEFKRAEERLTYLAQHDALTDLPNRLLLTDRMNVAMNGARRSGNRMALLFMNLDRFRNVNDSLGHRFGDQLLRGLAERLKASLRAADTVSRHGGDEFVVLIPDIAEAQAAARVAEKLIGAISQPFRFGETEIELTGSVGIACFPENGAEAEALLRNADAAMHAAKRLGRNRYQFYSSEMNERARERLSLESDLRHAVERDQLFLVYQPQIDLRTGSLAGVEALVRWKHREQGIVSPGQFIPIAEESGLIVQIGSWVLETACRQQMRWIAAGLCHGPIAVNVSAHQFRQRDYVAGVAQALARTGLNPGLLELELTESVVMEGLKEVRHKLDELHRLGVKLAIDDFGTGYSSLSYLKQFPLHRLKIDQSFTSGLPEDHESSAISQAVISLGHSLGLDVLAEGIETQAQEDHLRQLGCDAAQGYLYAKPLSVGEITPLLRHDTLARAVPLRSAAEGDRAPPRLRS